MHGRPADQPAHIWKRQCSRGMLGRSPGSGSKTWSHQNGPHWIYRLPMGIQKSHGWDCVIISYYLSLLLYYYDYYILLYLIISYYILSSCSPRKQLTIAHHFEDFPRGYRGHVWPWNLPPRSLWYQTLWAHWPGNASAQKSVPLIPLMLNDLTKIASSNASRKNIT